VLRSLIRRMVRGARTKHNARAGRAATVDLEQARALQHSGDLARARVLCEGILSRDASHAGAHALLGALFGQEGDLVHAHHHLMAALRVKPDLEEARLGLGNVYLLRGDARAAAAEYRQALAVNADSAIVHLSLGRALRAQGDNTAALEHFHHALALSPMLSGAVVEAVQCHVRLGTCQQALALAAAAVQRCPGAAELHVALGFAYQNTHRAADALECYKTALALDGADADVYTNLGIVYQHLGCMEESLVSFGQALALARDSPLAHFHRGLARLLMGDYANGWADYEMRLLSEDRLPRPVAAPRWDGSALEGRTLLVFGEQGLGDEIMFASCLPDVLAAAGQCVIECHPKLEGIFRRSFPRAAVYAAAPPCADSDAARIGHIDFEVPIGSLPLYLRRSPAEFPRHAGYLEAEAGRVAAWRKRLAALGPGVKAGISWAGGTYRSRSPLRSIALEQWRPILETPGVRFVSLQYGDVTPALKALAVQGYPRIEHWQDAIDDYEETAALVSALDVVISVQTAVVHLTGALGKTAWVIVPCAPEWRYGIAGPGMPWYPSVRVFRQTSAGEWGPVLDAVAGELRALADAPAQPIDPDATRRNQGSR